jgi:hypothetical protein
MYTKCWSENLKGKHPSEDLDINRRITDLKEAGWEVVDWIHLTQDRDQCQVLVSIVMNF